MRAARTLGWDVGGANLKAALVGPRGTRAITRAHDVWRAPDLLAPRLEAMARRLTRGRAPDLVGLTLTAELSDIFATRREGVAFVLAAVRRAAGGAPVRVFAVDGSFLPPGAALRRPLRVASANWAATARWVAERWPDALLLDVGSTTTDIIPIVGGTPVARGSTDLERLRSGELVYTGAVRTPVAALARRLPLHGGRVRLAAERFAQSGDVHLLLGRLAPTEYGGETPDGRGKTRAAAASRLARMLCAEPSELGRGELRRIAEHLAEAQVREIAAAVRQVLGRLGRRAPRLAVVAGSGVFLARAAAARAHLPARDLARRIGREGSRAAAAVAVASLLRDAAGRPRRAGDRASRGAAQ